MDRLKEIIGPAPSELTPEALVRKVEREQRRSSAMLAAFREQPVKRSRKSGAPPKPRKATNKDLKEAAEAMGLSVEDMIALAKTQKEKEDAEGSTD